jgi:hypothetical protein
MSFSEPLVCSGISGAVDHLEQFRLVGMKSCEQAVEGARLASPEIYQYPGPLAAMSSVSSAILVQSTALEFPPSGLLGVPTEAAPEEATPGPLLVRIVLGQWAQRSAESGMGTTSSCTPVSTFFSLWPCITTSAPILQSFVFNSSEEEMCQHVPFASVAMPPLFIALRVVLVDAIFAS